MQVNLGLDFTSHQFFHLCSVLAFPLVSTKKLKDRLIQITYHNVYFHSDCERNADHLGFFLFVFLLNSQLFLSRDFHVFTMQ